jgi:hypothetical protein
MKGDASTKQVEKKKKKKKKKKEEKDLSVGVAWFCIGAKLFSNAATAWLKRGKDGSRSIFFFLSFFLFPPFLYFEHMEDPDAYLEESERTRQLILTTCTALGGYEDSISPDGQVQRHYTLGDEALRTFNGHRKLVLPFILIVLLFCIACLKDLKRIIRANELLTKDVLIELNVLETDLIPIILSQPKKMTPAAERLVLACGKL